MKVSDTCLLLHIFLICLLVFKNLHTSVASSTCFSQCNKKYPSFVFNTVKVGSDSKGCRGIHIIEQTIKQKHIHCALLDSTILETIPILAQDTTLTSHPFIAALLTALENMKTEVETIPSNTNMVHLAGDVVAGLLGGSIGVFGTLVSLEWKVQQMEEESKCPYCQGAGILPCASCSASGKCELSNCKTCSGAGHLNCINCKGEGLAVPLALDKKVNRDPDTPLERYGFGLKPNPTIRHIKDGTSQSSIKITDSNINTEKSSNSQFTIGGQSDNEMYNEDEALDMNLSDIQQQTSLSKYYRFSTRIKYKRGLIELPDSAKEGSRSQHRVKNNKKRELELSIN